MILNSNFSYLKNFGIQNEFPQNQNDQSIFAIKRISNANQFARIKVFIVIRSVTID